MTDYCRLCLSDSEPFYPLFLPEEVETLAIPLSMQVTMCTSVMVSMDENFSKGICSTCYNFIQEWLNFRKKCNEANESLKNRLEDNYDQNIPEPEIQLEESQDNLNLEFNLPESEKETKSIKSGKRKKKEGIKPPEPKKKTRGYSIQCCGQMFKAKRYFCDHIRKFHPGEKPFFCDECGKKDFISEDTLRRHKMLHSGKHTCEECGKKFTCQAILKIHFRDKHEQDRPFVCDVCGKAYVTELLLSYHQRFHTGEKKYVCEVCGLAVVTSSSLAKHRRTHSAVKPHVCHMCGKGFIVRARLVEHMRVHTGERPFPCHLCGKRFAVREKLKRHERIHSHHKPYCCDVCGHAYTTNHGLTVHRRTHQPAQQE